MHCDGEGQDEAVDESHGSGHGAQIKRRDTDKKPAVTTDAETMTMVGERTPPGVVAETTMVKGRTRPRAI